MPGPLAAPRATLRHLAKPRGQGSGRLLQALVLSSWLVVVSSASAADGTGAIEPFDPRFDALVPPGTAVEVIADGHAWTEGPLWDAAGQALLFSDVPRNTVFRWTADAGVRIFLPNSGFPGDRPFAGPEPGSNGLAFDPEGRLVLCQHGNRRIARRDPDGTLTPLVERYQGRRLNSPNDLVFRSNGDLYFTDPPYGLPGTFADPEKELPHQGVYRLSRDGSLTLVVADLEAPNGIAFSPDEERLYVSNSSATSPLWMVYAVLPDGDLGKGRVFADARGLDREGEGSPDGLEVDREGNVFAAGPGGVHVFAPDGGRIGRIATGGPTGNVAWGEDGRTLFITAGRRILRVRTGTGRAPSPPSP